MIALALGPEYSFSHSAAKKYFESKGTEAEIKLLLPPNRTEGIIEELVKIYQKGDDDVVAIIPVLNTIEGRVKETIGPGRGLLKYYPDVKIRGEYWFRIKQCLAGNGALRDITDIVSHPQALGQCRKYIDNLGAKTTEARSTSEAAELASKDKTEKTAAICSEDAAIDYHLNVLASDIADRIGQNSENWTRFFVVSKTDSEPTGKDKTTMVTELNGSEIPGTLLRALGPFADINIPYIESMMKGSRTDYVFWVDVDEHRKNMPEELEGLEKQAKWLQILGSYPREI